MYTRTPLLSLCGESCLALALIRPHPTADGLAAHSALLPDQRGRNTFFDVLLDDLKLEVGAVTLASAEAFLFGARSSVNSLLVPCDTPL